jgi:hypothetical protein
LAAIPDDEDEQWRRREGSSCGDNTPDAVVH